MTTNRNVARTLEITNRIATKCRHPCREPQRLRTMPPAAIVKRRIWGAMPVQSETIQNAHSLEADIRTIGEEIFHRAEDAAPSIFSRERWQQMAMEWMTGDEDLKG